MNMRVGRAVSINSRRIWGKTRDGGMFSKYHETLTTPPSITARKGLVLGWKVKVLSYVRRSFCSRGTNLSGPWARWDDGGKSSCLSGRAPRTGLQCVAAIQREKINKRVRANSLWVILQSFILSDRSLLTIKSFNLRSLFCLAYMSGWQSCATALSGFFTASWSIFLIVLQGRQIPSGTMTLLWRLAHI